MQKQQHTCICKKNTLTKIKPKYNNKNLATGGLQFDLLILESAATPESKTTFNLKN